MLVSHDTGKLMINGNELSGSLPAQIYNLEKLTHFYGHLNKFTGTISSSIERLTKLEYFILRDNSFNGTVPSQLSNMQSMRVLWLHFNNFTGTVNHSFCEMYDEPFRLVSFYADCKSDDGGSPDITCDCCTDCCNQEMICLQKDD